MAELNSDNTWKGKRFNRSSIQNVEFFKIPKAICDNPRFKNSLSNDARILYARMLDRLSLSIKNNWIDENGDYFIVYRTEDLIDDICVSKPTLSNIKKMLVDAGLLDIVKRGQGKVDLFYLLSFEDADYTMRYKNTDDDILEESSDFAGDFNNENPEVKNLYFKKSKNFTSRISNFEPNNNTNLNNNNKELEDIQDKSKINMPANIRERVSKQDLEKAKFYNLVNRSEKYSQPSNFTRELIKINYIKDDEFDIPEYNSYFDKLLSRYGYKMIHRCLKYFVSQIVEHNGLDANYNPIQNKLAFFKTSIKDGIRQELRNINMSEEDIDNTLDLIDEGELNISFDSVMNRKYK